MKQGFSQEGLKLAACIAMLFDHIGAVLVPLMPLRAVGRIAFPIYCFLLAEGAAHTRNPRRYALRMGLSAVVSEICFDYAFGGYNPQHQNVMVTLLLGFCALEVMKRCPNYGLKVMAFVPFALLADALKADYGAEGIMMIALFGLTRELPNRIWMQCLGLFVLCRMIPSLPYRQVGGFVVMLQDLAVLAMLPISLYTGEKATSSKAVQMGFYLFYPAHLAVLGFVSRM